MPQKTPRDLSYAYSRNNRTVGSGELYAIRAKAIERGHQISLVSCEIDASQRGQKPLKTEAEEPLAGSA
jgi:hypothetical protein